MLKLAHISDIHLSHVPQTLLRLWQGKRFLGGLNMVLLRRRELRNRYLPFILRSLASENPDLIVVSGDLTTTSLPKEFTQARKALLPFISQKKLLTIPGNHDIYLPSSARKRLYESHFGECHWRTLDGHPYPHFTLLEEEKVIIIALNSCLPTGFFQSWGKIEREELERLRKILSEYKDYFRIVVLHHYIEDKHGGTGLPRRGLKNREELLEILALEGAELILHGHEHAVYRYEVEGNRGRIPVFCVGPATRHSFKKEKQGGYQIYEIEEGVLQRVRRWHFDPRQKEVEEIQIWP